VEAVTWVIEAGAGGMRLRVAMQTRGMKKIALEAICKMIGLFGIAARSQAAVHRVHANATYDDLVEPTEPGKSCRYERSAGRSGAWPQIKPIAGSQLYTGCWHRHLAEALTVSSD
jgi:hypothetical protein